MVSLLEHIEASIVEAETRKRDTYHEFIDSVLHHCDHDYSCKLRKELENCSDACNALYLKLYEVQYGIKQ